MRYKFEDLEVWQLSLELNDMVYEVSSGLPDIEKFNLMTQINRAVTSISLNIAEGSTSQTDKEQTRFIGYAIRSLIEVIGCIRLMERRGYIMESELKENLESKCNILFGKLQAFKRSLMRNGDR